MASPPDHAWPRLPSLRQAHPELRASVRTSDARNRLHSASDIDDGRTLDEHALIHLLDLRARFRIEERTMREQLDRLQGELELRSRELWQHYMSGVAAPAAIRAECDELVARIDEAERDIAHVRAAIEGAGEEIECLLAARGRPDRRPRPDGRQHAGDREPLN